MCRLLLISNPEGIDPHDHLAAFRVLSRNSREFQGHGWGCGWLDHSRGWQMHHSINPIWEDTFAPPKTTLLLVHARSAFRDEGIVVENNMPFSDGTHIFIFNGELRGVRIKAQGRIGAEKIFNTIKRFNQSPNSTSADNGLLNAVDRAVMVINKRTRYVRAMNFIVASSSEVVVCSQYSEDPDYFQLRQSQWHNTRVICSAEYDFAGQPWQRIENHKTFKLNNS